MKVLRYLAILILLSILVLVTELSANTPKNEPISIVGHGVMFDYQGNSIEGTREFALSAQGYYMAVLLKTVPAHIHEEFEDFSASINRTESRSIKDEVLWNAVRLYWLSQRTADKSIQDIQSKLKTLNRRYLIDHLGLDPAKERTDYRSGLPEYLLEYMPFGRGNWLRQITAAAGEAYIEECSKAGVPIPPDFVDGNWDSGPWTYNGTLVPDFLTPDATTDVY